MTQSQKKTKTLFWMKNIVNDAIATWLFAQQYCCENLGQGHQDQRMTRNVHFPL